jgi:hypothetical protein
MHAADSPTIVDLPADPTADLMVFTPARPPNNVDETVPSPVEALSETSALQSHPIRITSPPLDVSSHGAVSLARTNSEVIPSHKSKSSGTEREPSPIVRISPPATSAQLDNEEQIAQTAKKVRFDLSVPREQSTPTDSPDPLAPGATLRKKTLNKKRNIAAANQESPLPAVKNSKPAGRKQAAVPKSSSSKPAGILDQFKDGRLNSDSDDEEEIIVQMQTQKPVSDSQDTEPDIDLAERAVASLVEAAIEGQAVGTRRSGRARKAKDFGDVEVHGWKPKRTRRS